MRCSVEQAGEASRLLMGVTTEGAGLGSSGMAGIIQTGFFSESQGFCLVCAGKTFCLKTDTLHGSVLKDIARVLQSSIRTEHSASVQPCYGNCPDVKPDTPCARR